MPPNSISADRPSWGALAVVGLCGLAGYGTRPATAPAVAGPPLVAAADSIDRFVHRVVSELPDVPGLSIAVVHDSTVVYLGAAGFRDLEAHLPATPTTPYYVASSTKSFTGMAAALLASRGALDLDAPITRYIPELRLPPGRSADSVTLRRLLTHTAGLANEAIDIRTAYTGEYTPAQLISLLARSDTIGRSFHYGNLGYVVASLVMDRVTGSRWQEVLRSSIFAPLGLDHTTAYMSRAARWEMAVPYLGGVDSVPRRLPGKVDATMHAAGGVVSTAADLAGWLEVNLNDGRLGGHQRLPAAAVGEAHRMQVALPAGENFGPFRRYGYALGWYWGEYGGDTLLHQFGEYAGARAHVSFMPQRHVGVAVLVNASGPSADVADLVATYAYDVVLGKPGVAARYDSLLAALATRLARTKRAIAADIARRAARPSTLSRPRTEYDGQYANPELGRLRVRSENGKMLVQLGPLEAAADFYTEPEAVRVEFTPGQGELIRFYVSGNAVDSLLYAGYVFRR